jgi:hypothetical protein
LAQWNKSQRRADSPSLPPINSRDILLLIHNRSTIRSNNLNLITSNLSIPLAVPSGTTQHVNRITHQKTKQSTSNDVINSRNLSPFDPQSSTIRSKTLKPQPSYLWRRHRVLLRQKNKRSKKPKVVKSTQINSRDILLSVHIRSTI